MKNFYEWLKWVGFLSLIWIILFEKFTWMLFTSGLLISMVTLLLVEKLLLGKPVQKAYPLAIFWLIKYTFSLLFIIYKSGLDTLKSIITGQVSPGVIEVRSELKDPVQISILANSITLTPGTVTLDKKDNKLVVLWLKKVTDDPEEGKKLILEPLERHFKKERGPSDE